MNHAADTKPAEASERRTFLTRFTAFAVGTALAIFPFAAGWGVFSHPLKRRRAGADESGADHFLRVCRLDDLPADGVPRLFPVVSDVVDAWSRVPAQRIGSVYLTRTDADAKPTVVCFTTTCPHLGCAVDYIAAAGQYECPCHASAFAKDGTKIFGPSLRGLDPLEVKLIESHGDTAVLIEYQRFRSGVAERIPLG